MILTDDQILAAFRWDDGKELSTKRGDRILRKAPATPEALVFWKANRPELTAAGVNYGLKWRSETEYELVWWKEIPKEVMEQREKNVQMSRATDATILIPCPAGKAFLPYQKAGIAFILNVFGDKY